MPEQSEIVWLVDDNFNRFPAELIRLGAFSSTVKYTRGGIDYEVVVTNDEFEYGEGNDGDDKD